MERDYLRESKVFKALADEKRLRILDLIGTGEKCTCVLIEEMNMGQSSLSYHMKVLSEADIVEGRADGKWTHYKICEKGMKYAEVVLERIMNSGKEGNNQNKCIRCDEKISEKSKSHQ